MRLLIDYGALIDLQPSEGEHGSALAAAVSRHSVHAVEGLLAAGADVNMSFRVGNYRNAFHASRRQCISHHVPPLTYRAEQRSTSVEIQKLLVAAGGFDPVGDEDWKMALEKYEALREAFPEHVS